MSFYECSKGNAPLEEGEQEICSLCGKCPNCGASNEYCECED